MTNNPRKYILCELQELEVKGRLVCSLLRGNQPLLNIAIVEGYTFSLSAYPATIVPAQSIMLVEPIVLRL
jgi:hypothetical protein